MPIKGLANGRRQCEPIWYEFQSSREELIFECERILAFRENQKIELKYERSSLPDVKIAETGSAARFSTIIHPIALPPGTIPTT